MTWTYSPGFISQSGTTPSLYKIRFMVGDTDTTRQQLQDEEIYGILTYVTSPTLAAAAACDGLAAKYGFQVNSQNGSLQLGAERRMKHYMDLADRLRDSGAGDMPGNIPGDPAISIYVGGASVASKDSFAADDDFVQPVFKLGVDDNPFVDSGTGASAGF